MGLLRIGFWVSRNNNDVFYHRPLGIGYIKAYIDAHLSPSVEIHMIHGLERDPLLDNLDVLMISSLSQDIGEVDSIIKYYKEICPKGIIILGGQHITNFPVSLPVGVSVGVVGEGEVTTLELIKCIQQTGGLAENDIKKVKGIVYRDKSQNICRTKHRQMLENIDELPIPDRLFDGGDKQLPYLLTSRGCPYECTFCASQAYWKKPRYFSARYVIKEIKRILSEYLNVNFLGIWDDLFVANRSRLIEIKDLFKAEGLHRDIQMACNIRANFVCDELCEILQDMNITAVSFGFESGNNKILKALKPQAATVEANLAALEKLKEYNISTSCSFIIGSPGETIEQLNSTYEIALSCMKAGLINEPHVNILMPMPGTFYWSQAIESEFINVSDIDWSRLRYYASFRDSEFESVEEWVEARRKNNSIYLNADLLPESDLLDIMKKYEHEIDDIIELRSSQPLFPYKYWASIDTENHNNAHSLMLNNINNNEIVLECGCSGGHMTEHLSKKGCIVDAVDINASIIKRARPYARTTICGDLDDPLFKGTLPKQRYDVITFGDTLEHLKDPEACLKGLAYTLKKDGRIIVSLPNIAHGSIRLKLFYGQFKREETGILDRTHLQFYDLEGALKMFERSGFFVESVFAVTIPLEDPISEINLEDYPERLVQILYDDETVTDYQYVFVARFRKANQYLRTEQVKIKRLNKHVC